MGAHERPSRPRSGRRLGAALARAALAALLAAACLPLAACKDTDVLTVEIRQPGAEVDYSKETQYKNVDDATPDDRAAYESARSDRQQDQSQEIPQYDELPTQVQEIIREQHAADAQDDSEAVQGDRQGDGQQSGAGDAQGGDASNPGNGADGDGASSSGDGAGGAGGNAGGQAGGQSSNQGDAGSTDEATGTSTPDNNQAAGASTGTGGRGGQARVYTDGEYDSLPAGTRRIAATGQYALIVQMLAGKGALVAADEEFLAEMRASAAFPDEGLENVVAAWSGDGASAGSADVSAVIAAGPDAVLVGSNAASVTQEEADLYREAGINVVVMPAIGDMFASDADIVTSVRVVGELLKSADTQYDASAMAQQYERFHDEVLASVVSANGGYTTYNNDSGSYLGSVQVANVSTTRFATCYVDAWVASPVASATVARGPVLGFYPNVTGSPYFADGASVALDLTPGMGVIPTRGTLGPYMLLDYYLQHGGAIDVSHTGSWHFRREGYVGHEAESGYFDVSAYGRVAFSVPDPAGLTGGDVANANVSSVGEKQYPAVITRDRATALGVASSGASSTGVYNYGLPYEAWVMPSGVSGSWADGTVESFLIAPWSYCMLQLGGDLSDCSEFASDFYGAFFRCGDFRGAMASYGDAVSVDCPNETPDGRYQDHLGYMNDAGSRLYYYKTPGVLHGWVPYGFPEEGI